MTFTPLHLELLARIYTGALPCHEHEQVYLDFAAINLIEANWATGLRLTDKGRALLSFLCTAADGGFRRPIAVLGEEAINRTPDLPLSEPVLPVETQLRDIREWLAAQTGFIRSQHTILGEIRDILRFQARVKENLPTPLPDALK